MDANQYLQIHIGRPAFENAALQAEIDALRAQNAPQQPLEGQNRASGPLETAQAARIEGGEPVG